MQSSHIHSSYHQHVSQVSHSRILSHFYLMGSTPGPHHKLKTIPHSLYDDPAFSADPSANPLCSANCDISPWVTNPPNGHPSINPRGRLALIQPPNSPPSTSLPDLSSTASSASDSSLPTSAAQSGSRLSLTTMANNKKSIGFPFFKRRSLPTPVVKSHPTNVGMSPSTAVQSKHPGSFLNSQPQINRAINSTKPPTRVTKPSQVPRGHQHPAGKARELDMIDELDESNPMGIALHHGGPYEAIQRMVGSRTYPQQAPYNPSQQQFRLDVPLNLSPGQVLPHSVTPYYRPRAPLGPVSNVQERIDFGTRGPGLVTRQSNVNYSPANLGPNRIDHLNPYGPPRDAATGPLHRQILPDNRFEAPNTYHSVNSHSFITNNEPVMEEVRYDPANKEHVMREQEQDPHDVNGDPSNQQQFNTSGDGQSPYEILTDKREAEERLQGPPHDSRRLERVLPAIQNQDMQQELSSGSVPNRPIYETHPSLDSSNSSLQSGASSVMTGMTTASFRNRVLPKQLVMPSPLAKAAVSSRPQPTHLPQNVQYWQNIPRQHRIRFHDGTEYELPVTNSNGSHMVDIPPNLEISHKPTESPTRTISISTHNGKLKKRSSLRGPEPPEIVARLAAAPNVMQKSRYMEPPPTIPEHLRLDNNFTAKGPVKQGMKRLLTKRRSALEID